MNGYLVQIPLIRTFEIMGGGWSATFLFQFSNTFPDSLIPESGLKVLVLDQAIQGSHADSDAWPRGFHDPWSLSESSTADSLICQSELNAWPWFFTLRRA